MSKVSKYFGCLIVAACVGMSAGCAPTAERRATGEVIDDAALTTRVKTALLKAQNVNATAINVNTYRGEVVLSGYVENPEMASRAAEAVRRVPGVRVLRNDLRVTPRR